MRITLLNYILLILLTVFSTNLLYATTISRPFYPLKEDVTSNATMAAMGGTSLGALGQPDFSTIHPAGITVPSVGGVNLNHYQWMGDIEYNTISAGIRIGKHDVFGLFYRRANHGNFPAPYDPDWEGGWPRPAWIDASLHDASLIYGRELLPALAVGVQLHYFWIEADDWYPDLWYKWARHSKRSLDNMALSVGALFNPGWNDFTAAISHRYLPFTSDYSPSTGKLAHLLQASVGIDLVQLIGLDQYWPHTNVYTAGDWIYHGSQDARKRLGIEYGYREILYVRAGYSFVARSYTRANLSRGIGLHLPLFGLHLHLDYAFRNLTDPVHWYSVGVRW